MNEHEYIPKIKLIKIKTQENTRNSHIHKDNTSKIKPKFVVNAFGNQSCIVRQNENCVWPQDHREIGSHQTLAFRVTIVTIFRLQEIF